MQPQEEIPKLGETIRRRELIGQVSHRSRQQKLAIPTRALHALYAIHALRPISPTTAPTASATTTAIAPPFGVLNRDTIIIEGSNRRRRVIPPKGELASKVVISPKIKLMKDLLGEIFCRAYIGGGGEARIHRNNHREGSRGDEWIGGRDCRLRKEALDGWSNTRRR